jgi:hypothetical protein
VCNKPLFPIPSKCSPRCSPPTGRTLEANNFSTPLKLKGTHTQTISATVTTGKVCVLPLFFFTAMKTGMFFRGVHSLYLSLFVFFHAQSLSLPLPVFCSFLCFFSLQSLSCACLCVQICLSVCVSVCECVLCGCAGVQVCVYVHVRV